MWLAAALVTTLASFAGTAAADDASAQQRARIAAERNAIQKRFDAEERACEQQFVVTSCVNAARKERRDALAPLRQDELRIDKLERKQRASARLEEIEVKRAADTVKEVAAPAEPPATTASARPVPSASQPARPAEAFVKPSTRPALSAAERERREAGSQARFDAAQAEAQQRRAAADARNAKRAAAGKVARPLPLPPASVP